jgi:beta-glucosidase-like glycosyl hydrolase
VITGLLRGELGFGGVVVTDALEMRAISGTVGADEGAVRAIEAGADALCLGHDLRPDEVHMALVGAVRSGRLAEERLGEAAERVRLLGLTAAPPDGEVARGVGLEAARRAIRVDGEVVLSRPALVVELLPKASIAAGEANHGLGEILPSATVVRLRDAPLDPRSLLAGYPACQLVVVVQDAHRHTWQRVAAKGLLEAAPDGVLVEVGVPEWRPNGANYLATHGLGRVNLEAAAERLQDL